jgi:hypothetical protein
MQYIIRYTSYTCLVNPETCTSSALVWVPVALVTLIYPPFFWIYLHSCHVPSPKPPNVSVDSSFFHTFVFFYGALTYSNLSLSVAMFSVVPK